MRTKPRQLRSAPFDVVKEMIVSGPNLLARDFAGKLNVYWRKCFSVGQKFGFRISEGSNFASGSINLDLQIGGHPIGLAERQNVLAPATVCVSPDGVVRRNVGSFRN